jgi:tetratricopeptide (TPR) repeat protein
MFDPSSIERRLGRYNADVYDWAQNTLTTAVIATIMVAVTVKAAAQAADDLNALNEQVSRLYQQGKIDQAYLIARRYVASARAQFGDEHQEYAAAIASLATVYRKQGHHSKAEPLHKRSLAIFEKVLGPDHQHVGNALNELGELYRDQGRYAEAELFHQRSLAQSQKSSNSLDVATSLNNLALLYANQVRFSDAEPLLKRSLAIRERVLGPNHVDVSNSLNNFGDLYYQQGAMPRPSRSTSAASPSAKPPWAPLIPWWALRSTIWPGYTRCKAALRKRRRSISAALQCMRPRWGLLIQRWARRSTI